MIYENIGVIEKPELTNFSLYQGALVLELEDSANHYHCTLVPSEQDSEKAKIYLQNLPTGRKFEALVLIPIRRFGIKNLKLNGFAHFNNFEQKGTHLKLPIEISGGIFFDLIFDDASTTNLRHEVDYEKLRNKSIEIAFEY